MNTSITCTGGYISAKGWLNSVMDGFHLKKETGILKSASEIGN